MASSTARLPIASLVPSGSDRQLVGPNATYSDDEVSTGQRPPGSGACAMANEGCEEGPPKW
eukprot:CAMPEP_0182542570 /NCGR_PEP_ID=MMETSP1323-20130603/30357_1 /TAXON_ID=236787 /ORGANISM="Florenciella parvula, Strain RCC1693" /LENGTH=60 /DNA_ID=CAMNT_0024753435 /DNA_START=91 /DNA_END=270 /DNA_ORIENTATION=-